MIITARSSNRPLTPARFAQRVDETYAQARWNLTRYGQAAETLIVLNGKGRELLTANSAPEPFSRRSQVVKGIIRQYHATAAIHVCEAYLGWLSGDPEVDAMRPGDRPDREEVLVVAGVWPLMKISDVRYATVLRSGGVVDVVDLDLSTAMDAAGPGLDGTITSTSASWLAELLPRR